MALHNSTRSISISIEATIATIEFGHPASNSFPSSLLHELTQTIETVGHHPEVVVVVLKSQGAAAFCAGASFEELQAITNEIEGKAFFSGFAHLINAMRKCPKIIVGRVQGKTVGGGVGIAAACDYVLATQEANIKLSELAIGIGPFVIEPAVSRKIGKTALAELSLAAGEWKSAAWAKEKGLYANTFETIEKLDDALSILTRQLASYNPEALAEMKKVLWDGTSHWDTLLLDRAAITGTLVLSEVTKKALAAFKK
ncbi:enoyl-CoA hydratase/isomerase family protein [Flavobacterium sp.]|jgi:methylglutaconyl-CoA hydratase|uniref:enoyl-CoA hydratase/isomerase family protein n=1 Tax=Flavobacterium sp. TaxID=239 RepID=UPI0008B6F726|nr:enoyl-CoA hydratase/isomerase family protein [Flavobacterium sp.]OGS65419.1 MAG: enoyl-CoA hydratase [Flavobacteria bacterium GWA2_35_26]HCF03690.1 enoyl-CoA hydratase [Flavobacterium sp.]